MKALLLNCVGLALLTALPSSTWAQSDQATSKDQVPTTQTPDAPKEETPSTQEDTETPQEESSEDSEREEPAPATKPAPTQDPLRPTLQPPGDPLVEALVKEESGQAPEGSKEGTDRQYNLGSEQVTGQRREVAKSGAVFDIELGQLGDLPLASAADVMMLAPGVLTSNHGGEGHAHETFMRGFYAGEGQDIEYMVDGVPVNEVSNPHGHGYTDLFFLPAGWIKSMRLSEGAFDPEQGDFAFAGSINFVPGVGHEGLHVQGGLGSFGTRRLELTWAPAQSTNGTFAGVEIQSADGFGANRASQRAASMLRYASDPGGSGLRYSVMLAGYLSRYAQPGVLRADDVERGDVDFYGTYDATQGGDSTRVLGSVRFAYGPNDALFENVVWLGQRSMRLRQNFTGFLTPTQTLEEGTVYLGDLQEGRYDVATAGARGSYTLGRTWRKRYQELSVGYSARLDTGRTELVRLRDRLDVPYAVDFDRGFDITNIATWMRAQSELADWLVVRGGVRVDTFQFNVRDFNQPTEDTDGLRLPEQTSGADGLALNPRVSAVVRLGEDLRWTSAYGRGTRSTDAAALSDTESATFAVSDQVETGLKWQLQKDHHALSVQGSYVYALVERDIVFSPEAGRNVLIGASQRHALLFQSRYTHGTRVDVLANVGLARATTEERDPTSLDFGQTVLLPYVPQLIARLDATYRHPFDVRVGGVPLALRTTANLTYTPGRPLPLGETGDPFTLVGAALSLELWHTTLRLEGRNLLGSRYRQSEFNYPSRFDPTRPLPASGAPRSERHFVAGEPRFVMLSVELDVSKIFGEAPSPAASEP